MGYNIEISNSPEDSAIPIASLSWKDPNQHGKDKEGITDSPFFHFYLMSMKTWTTSFESAQGYYVSGITCPTLLPWTPGPTYLSEIGYDGTSGTEKIEWTERGKKNCAASDSYGNGGKMMSLMALKLACIRSYTWRPLSLRNSQ